MNRKWNLQDIRPAKESAKPKEIVSEARPRSDIEAPRKHHRERPDRPEPQYSSIDVIDSRSAKRRRVILASIVGISILVLGYIVSILMGGAEVTVYPKYKDPTVQATFTAHVAPEAGELSYELLTLEADGERQVSATGQEEVSERATGNIVIYNEFSTTPQRLIKNTRFESPEGLIFRIEESVEVPGMTTDTEGNSAPGVVTATVFADGTGEQYNIGPTTFTIPGLEGTEQFDAMYGESTAGFTGGFEGSRFIIDEEELQLAQQSLRLELRDALRSRVEEERPAGFILYEDAITFTFDTLPATEYGDQLATIKERARLQVPLFKEGEFAEYLAKNTVPGYEEGDPVALADPFTLGFSYHSATTSQTDLSTVTEIEFDLEGQTRIIWEYDEEALKNDLASLQKTALPTVLSGYPAIERAEAVVRPFWKQSFPEDVGEISIVTKIREGSE